MNISLTMEYVLLRASQEASAFSGGNMGLEHIFLGILMATVIMSIVSYGLLGMIIR